jgi:hypothetical protein
MSKTKETPKHETMAMGFDRTQLFKEWVQPQINRSSALSTTTTIIQSYGLKLTNKEILALCEKYILYLETGDTTWADTVDDYINKNHLKIKELVK